MTVAGGVAALASVAPTRATYSMTGEGGSGHLGHRPRVNFTMNGPSASTLVVALNPSTLPTHLGGTIGSAGTATLGVGGTFNLPSTQTSGAYSGSYTVSVAYN